LKLAFAAFNFLEGMCRYDMANVNIQVMVLEVVQKKSGSWPLRFRQLPEGNIYLLLVKDNSDSI
jgi:hypothetical protein